MMFNFFYTYYSMSICLNRYFNHFPTWPRSSSAPPTASWTIRTASNGIDLAKIFKEWFLDSNYSSTNSLDLPSYKKDSHQHKVRALTFNRKWLSKLPVVVVVVVTNHFHSRFHSKYSICELDNFIDSLTANGLAKCR
jgi:hypothetical protein